MRIATLDLETDPFQYGKMIDPFVSGFYDGERFITWWSDDCVARTVKFLEGENEPYTIYIHNGGRFDLFWFLPYLGRDVRIINGRIVQAWIGRHEIRDSFAIMPFPLEAYRKTKIDYERFKRGVREKFKEEIVSYLRDDCTDLHTLCVAFVEEFKDALTIGSASMREIKKVHKFSTGNEQYDKVFRDAYYFGGRNQVFKAGITNGPIKIYDVNSMYPFVMRNFLHPISTGFRLGRIVSKHTSFVKLTGRNLGAFPVRLKDGSLDFTQERGTFCVSVHEYHAALETGTFIPYKIEKTIDHMERGSFDLFVNKFYEARLKAQADKDKIHSLFYKFVLNSGYGKFAQNPENYFDWRIQLAGEYPDEWHDCIKSCDPVCRLRWEPAFLNEGYVIWKRPLKEHRYFNIATGASITGAARALLLRGISRARKPLYVDTDSIICESFSGNTSATELGAWKLEGEGTSIAIAGKKMYAVFDAKGECVKCAHKGARISPAQIRRVALGDMVESQSPVPAFKFDGTFSFTKRRIRKTA